MHSLPYGPDVSQQLGQDISTLSKYAQSRQDKREMLILRA